MKKIHIENACCKKILIIRRKYAIKEKKMEGQ
jgi:hypothetical protein